MLLCSERICYTLLYLTCFATINICTVGTHQGTFKIGGIFTDSERNGPVENAFRFAVERINSNRSAVMLQPRLRYVLDNSSFLVTQQVCELVEEGVQVVLGPSDPILARHVQSVCDALDVPHIQWISAPSGCGRNFGANLYPNQPQMNRALADLMHTLHWNRIMVLYSGEAGLIRLQGLFRVLLVGVDLDIRKISTKNMGDVLQEIKLKEHFNILVDIEPHHVELFLKSVTAKQMHLYTYHYIFTTLDMESTSLGNLGGNFINMSSYRLVDADNPSLGVTVSSIMNQGQQFTSSLHNPTNPIQSAAALVHDAVLLVGSALYYLRASRTNSAASCTGDRPSMDGATLLNYINMIKYGTGITGMVELNGGLRKKFKLDLIKLYQQRLVKVGEWREETGVVIQNTGGFYETGEVNVTLVVTANLDRPYVMLKDDTSLVGNDRFEGFSIDLLRAIAEFVGFNFTIVLNPDGLYGAQDTKTGTWNGIVRQLIDKKADIAIGSFSINFARDTVIDFTKPFMNLGISILFKVPSSAEARLFSFMTPLAVEIWLYVLAAYMLVSLTMFVVAKFSPYEWHQHPCTDQIDIVENHFSLFNSFWFTIGTLMQQGSDLHPKAISTRLVSGIWWFFTLIMISSYTANLAAFLTVERMITPIGSVEDLADQSEISYGSLEGGSTMAFFRDSKIDTYKKIWRFMEARKNSVFTKTYEDGIHRVLQGNYAFLAESTTIDYIVNRNCNLTQIGGLLDSKGYGIATTRGSPWRDQISLAILEMQEKSVIHTLYNKWWRDTSASCLLDLQLGNKANALSVVNIGGVFVVLLVGLAFAIFVAVLEFCWISRKNAHLDQQSLCREMMDELQFAMRCHGSQQKPALTRHCEPCLTPSRSPSSALYQSRSHHRPTPSSVGYSS